MVAPAMVWELRTVGGSVRRSLTRSGPERYTAVQSLKAAGAALLAWALTGWWWHAPLALLAPWTALFLMQSTVYRSLVAGLQQFVVVVLGTLLAALAGVLTDSTMGALAVALPLTVLLGNYARFGGQGLYAPTAALFVIAGGSYGPVALGHRLLETAVGAVVGITVNALVLPPEHARRVRQLRTQLAMESGRLLDDAAGHFAHGEPGDGPGDWRDRAQWLGDILTELREAQRWSQESNRLNPGRHMRRSAGPDDSPGLPDTAWYDLTDHLSGLTRTLTDLDARPDDLPAEALRPLPSLLHGAALVFHRDAAAKTGSGDGGAGPDGPYDEDALATAWRARDELLAALPHTGRATSTGAALSVDTERLLSALARALAPEARAV
ncbi:FUSC family protein [Streptomyces sp. NPDC008150]|uniref:FUSC family protein n=1 Tax=Streptomyces sp. NPDC008150 TaxID=3364816 RepID=UPI0036EB2D5F